MDVLLGTLYLLLATSVHCQDVRRPPSITLGPSGQQVTKMGGSPVTIPCEASGVPQPTEFTWYKNGAQLDLNNQNIYRPDPTKGTIIIQSPSIFDEGYYQCTAKNDWGMARSDVCQVILAMLGGYPAPTVKSITVDEGSFQMLVCDPTKVVPNATFTWGVTSSTTDPSVTLVPMSERINMDAAGNLYFGNVMQSDWRNGQIYKCQVKNPWLDQMVGGSYITMAVTPKNVATVKPLLRYSTSSLVGLKGGEINMHCLFSGKESPKILWERTDGTGVLPVGRFDSLAYDTNLKIRDLRVEDKGSYRCTGTNTAGNAQQMVYLDVKIVPEFLNVADGPHDVNVTEGDDVVIQCRTNADPVAKVVWYINGNTFTANNRRRLSADNLNLTLVSVCRSCPDGSSDLMVVSCNASNSYGYTYSSGYVNILKKTEVTEAPVDTTMQFPYDVNMTCGGVSDPSTPVTVEWYDPKGNRLYNQTNHFEITQNDKGISLLRIIIANANDLGASKAGMYVCAVTNGFSTETRDAYVQENVAPVPTAAAASAAAPWWLFVIILVVLLLIFIIFFICYTCIKRNKGDVYKVDESEVKNGNNPKQELLDAGYKGYVRQEGEGPLRNSRASLGSHMSINSETGSLAEYEADYGKFNEEGSFIGAYKGDQRTPGHATNV